MADIEKKPESAETQPEDKPLTCSCNQDPFAAVPPELRPHSRNPLDGLRKVTCPGCGLVYWTNRKSDVCVDCEKKGVRLPVVSEAGNHEPEVKKAGPMTARVRPLAQLKKYIGGQPEIAVEVGQTVRDMLSTLAIPSEMVALVVVNGAYQDKDYCIQENDEILLYAIMSGG